MSVFEETDYSIESPASKGTLSGLNSTRIVNNPKLRHDINFGPELHFRPNLAGEKVARSTIRRLNPFMEPPVTKGTLSELDVTRIVNNPKLRHDINFDPELHFRPNVDGDKGTRKSEKADCFWETMGEQLSTFLDESKQSELELGTEEWCLPATLRAIEDIMKTLVHSEQHSSIEETFDVELLMQQFRLGVADLAKLGQWLSQLLKCHCAPMRDDWVDRVVAKLSKDDCHKDVRVWTDGLQDLVKLLEAMMLVCTPNCHIHWNDFANNFISGRRQSPDSTDAPNLH